MKQRKLHSKTPLMPILTKLMRALWKFKGDNGDPAKQLYLGSTLTIKGADTVASSAGANSAPHRNITTTAKDDGILEIALNQDLKGISSISGKNGSEVTEVQLQKLNLRMAVVVAVLNQPNSQNHRRWR